jgi:uncharacterized protein YjgD (DUF1641 family)
MKVLVMAVAILGSSLLNTSAAKGNLDIKKELKKAIKFEDNQLKIEKNETAFVKVSFTLNELGEVEVLDMNYSDEEIKTQLLSKLAKMRVKQIDNQDKVYHYNFTFKKL